MRHPLLTVLCPLLLIAATAQAEDIMPKPDDNVVYAVSAEDWVTTKTARVTVDVEAAVNGSNAGSIRSDMMKAVNDLSKADWRLTNFNRNLDATGLEHWSANYETRIPESQLNGLNENAKKLSKAGMQLTINDIDFSPTLDETEATKAALRTKLYKDVGDQLASLNTTLPGRGYRIASIDFIDGRGVFQPMPRVRNMIAMAEPVGAAVASPQEDQSAERAEKITLTARVVFAALPPAVH